MKTEVSMRSVVGIIINLRYGLEYFGNRMCILYLKIFHESFEDVLISKLPR